MPLHMFSCEFSKHFFLQNTFRRQLLKEKHLYGSSYKTGIYKQKTKKEKAKCKSFFFNLVCYKIKEF